jgi:hypothetical protein
VVRLVIEGVLEKLLRYKRLDRRQGHSAAVISSLLAATCILILAEEIGDR